MQQNPSQRYIFHSYILASTLNPAYRVFSSWPWEKECTPYRAVNTLRLVCKNQSVNAV